MNECFVEHFHLDMLITPFLERPSRKERAFGQNRRPLLSEN